MSSSAERANVSSRAQLTQRELSLPEIVDSTHYVAFLGKGRWEGKEAGEKEDRTLFSLCHLAGAVASARSVSNRTA